MMSAYSVQTGKDKSVAYFYTVIFHIQKGYDASKQVPIIIIWGLLTFLCAAERVSLWVLWVFVTASSSVHPRSPPGAGRARSVCRWWSGCKDSWRAQSGRPRRTKPRDWCSSGRWGAGPSDNLWSEKGETRRAEPGMKRVVRRMVKQIRRFGYRHRHRPLFCLQIKGSIQRAFSLSFTRSQRVRIKPGPSSLRSISWEYSPRKVNYIRLALLFVWSFSLLPFQRASKSLPLCYIDE